MAKGKNQIGPYRRGGGPCAGDTGRNLARRGSGKHFRASAAAREKRITSHETISCFGAGCNWEGPGPVLKRRIKKV